jgi:hypothetical protein
MSPNPNFYEYIVKQKRDNILYVYINTQMSPY